MAGVYQPDGGFVLSERAVVAYIMQAQALGAEIHAREAVRSWNLTRTGVVVNTRAGSYSARKLVISAGPWAAKLVRALAKRDLAVPERQVLIWTQPRRPDLFRLGRFPIFNMEAVDQGKTSRYYGFPIYGVPGFKFGKYHHRGEKIDPDRMDRDCHPADERVLREGIRRFFPQADGPTMAMKTCLFTNSPDENFVLDFHPESRRVAIAAGFSGHGFKFASAVGEIMADMVLDGESHQFKDLSLFSVTRPRVQPER